ncbi:MAG: DUF2927 domain-containing protein [Rhodospirillaceae bacterium]
MIVLLRTAVTVGVTAIMLQAAPAGAAEQRPSPKDLSAFFAEVAFGAEYLEKGSPVIQKWLEPIRINVSAIGGRLLDKPGGGKELKLERVSPKPEQINLIRKQMRTLLGLTGVKSESAKTAGKQTNYFIKFVPRLAMHAPFLVKGVDPALLKKLAAPGVCYFLTAAVKGSINLATIVFNNELAPDAMDACLLEEITQTLGLVNDSDKIKPSVFNNRAAPRELNRIDIILIKTLYDNRLPPGMVKKQALRRVDKIVAELDKKMP